MATLSEQDKLLNADQQKQIQAYKDQWAAANAAGDKDGMEAAHKAAEEIRNSVGYSGGADGSQVLLGGQPQRVGGQSAEDVQKWVDDYHKANQSYDPNRGHNTWNNGYSVGMNLRSMANYIRQQMDANSKAWAGADAETQAYLHDQNQQLAEILRKASGGAQSTYNEKEGRWETYNSNLGYGTDMSYVDPYLFDKDFRSKVYGQTEADWDKYRNDTDRYYNFVDTRTVRNWNDESSGFTGQYAQFVNGPYSQLMGGANYYVNPAVYMDIIGDNFGGEDEYEPVRDEKGNVVAQPPALKYNNADDYTRALAGYTENGVILPGVIRSRSADESDDPYRTMTGSGPNYAVSMEDMRDQMWRPEPGDIYNERDFYASAGSGGGGTGAGDLEAYLQQIYAANLASQLAQLEAAYQKNLSQLDETSEKTDANYTEQKRQTTGTSAQQAANWREMANAIGLNSGAFGQAALAQSNNLQGNLNALNTAQATAQADIERQRALLGQEYQLAILEAQANNDFEKAQALYNEAVRQDEALRQQEQFNAQMNLQYMQMLMSNRGSGSSTARASGSGGGNNVVLSNEDANSRYKDLYEDAYASTNPENYIASNYKKYGLTSATGLAAGYNSWIDSELNNGYSNAASAANNLIQTGGRDYAYLYNALLNQGYSVPVIDEVLAQYGG